MMKKTNKAALDNAFRIGEEYKATVAALAKHRERIPNRCYDRAGNPLPWEQKHRALQAQERKLYNLLTRAFLKCM
jgi:hypothetical protein